MIYESCVIAGISMYDNQKTKSFMTLPPDPDFATQVILRDHEPSYYYVQCRLEEISPILFQN